jgi:hypothetical protein
MNIYQMRHAILAQHRGGRVTPAQLKAELLEKFPGVKPQSVNASDCHYSDRKRAGSTCPECRKLGGFAVNRASWTWVQVAGEISRPSMSPRGTPAVASGLRQQRIESRLSVVLKTPLSSTMPSSASGTQNVIGRKMTRMNIKNSSVPYLKTSARQGPFQKAPS